MKTAIVLLALALACGVATADSVSLTDWAGSAEVEPRFSRAVIDSFPSPGKSPMGVDWVESRGGLYHVDEEYGYVYSITPEGTATFLFDMPTEIGWPSTYAIGNGMCHVQFGRSEYLYITDFHGHPQEEFVDRVYQFALDGTLIYSWDVTAVCPGVVGICFDGTRFWLSSADLAQIVKCDIGFNQVAVYDHPGGTCGALDYDPATGFYYVTEYIYGTIYVCDSEMNVVHSFAARPTAGGVLGVTVGRMTRDRSLWVSSFGTRLIYEIDDDYYSPVEETSWGSIKAMFR